ncbi:MAG: hypothetical protein IJX47_01055 [Clostridia bacterium]|nr:hypothetical protein [Clostridia bacterium]
MKRLNFTLVLVILVSMLAGCADTISSAPSSNGTSGAVTSKSTPSVTTAVITPAATTSVFVDYRPDLNWYGGGGVIWEDVDPIFAFQGENMFNGQAPFFVTVCITSEDDTLEVVKRFQPTEYLRSIGWEVLPKDAWTYTSNYTEEGASICVIPGFLAWETDIVVKDLLEYYDLDSSVIEKGLVTIGLCHAQLKTVSEMKSPSQ